VNIFFLDYDPQQAAQYHCNVHVLKMIIETAQLLSTAHWMLNPEETQNYVDKTENEYIYNKTHVNHPCAIWVRENSANYSWAVDLGLALLNEYYYRYEKSQHATAPKTQWLAKHYPVDIEKRDTITKPALAMPDEYKDPNPVIAYRKYYIYGKYEQKPIFRKYKKRSIPKFILDKDPSFGLTVS